MAERKIDLSQPFTREFRVDPAAAANPESRTIELAFASAAPVERWFGREVLDMAPGAVRLDRINSGGALLMDHSPFDQIGVVEAARLDMDGIARATVRFGRSPRASEILQDVRDGIRQLVSVGYNVHAMVLDSSVGGIDSYRITDWEPLEISIVSVPADPSVGIGRALEKNSPHHPADALRAGSNHPGEEPPMQNSTTPDIIAPAAEQIHATVGRDLGIEAERMRAREIRAIGARLGRSEDADRAVEAGTPLDQFKDQILARLVQGGTLRPAESPDIGMSGRDVQNYSFARAIMAASNPIEAHKVAPFELECSQAAQDRRGDSRPKDREAALTIPMDVLAHNIARGDPLAEAFARHMSAKRDLLAGTPNAGGYTIETSLLGSNFIEMLRQAMVLDRLGVTVLSGLNGNIAIPSQTGPATTYWVAEGIAPDASQQVIGQVAMSPKTVGAFTDFSRKLLLQSSLDVEMFVRADLAKMLGNAIQSAAIVGAAGGPTGILATSGIGSVVGGTNGAAPTYTHMVSLETAVAAADADVGALAYITNAKVRGKLRATEEFSTTNGRPIYTKAAGAVDGQVLGYTMAITNAVPSDLNKGTSTGVCSAIIFGNWADLILGMWGGLDLMVDPYTLATSGGRRVIALQDCDVAIRHVQSFAAMKDALTA